MQKVQEVSLLGIENPQFLKEEYESLGFYVERHEDHLKVYWGKPEKRKKKEETDEKRPERRSKTERRLGKKYYSSE
jgi:hypothetical protein